MTDEQTKRLAERIAARKAAGKSAAEWNGETPKQTPLDVAKAIDPQAAKRCEVRARRTIGKTFSVNVNGNRLTGKITICEFRGFTKSGYAIWWVRVTHENGGYVESYFTKLPR